MKTVMNHSQDGGLLKMIRRTDPVICRRTDPVICIRRYEPILKTAATEGHYSGEGIIIDKIKINVDFSYDNRAFFLLTISDKTNIYQNLFTGDVIDEKGNYFRVWWRED